MIVTLAVVRNGQGSAVALFFAIMLVATVADPAAAAAAAASLGPAVWLVAAGLVAVVITVLFGTV